METIELKLFVCGTSFLHTKARHSAKSLCERYLKDRYSLEVIDVLKEPWKAEEHNIIATPAMTRMTPDGERRVLGDFSDVPLLLMALGLEPPDDSQE